jgi:preprotein translocase subunit SecG
MNALTLAVSWSGFLVGLGVVFFILVCLLLIGVVLLQKGRGGGLSAAFGGGGGASPFGTKTGDVFTWITVVLAAMFLTLAVVLNLTYGQRPTVPEPPAAGQVEPETPAGPTDATPPGQTPATPATPATPQND